MSVKTAMDKTAATLEKGYTKTCSVISFIKSLSIKSKANFECAVDSTRKNEPLWRCSIGYDKSFKVSSIILTVLAILAVSSMLSGSKD